MKKTVLAILTLIVLILSGCGMNNGCRTKGYNDLTDEQKKIVDFYFENITEWELSSIKYGNFEHSGPDVLRSVEFSTYDGSLCLLAVYSLDYNATRLVFISYSNNKDMFRVANTQYKEIAYGNGNGWSQSWQTKWTDEVKKDELSRLLLNYYENKKG